MGNTFSYLSSFFNSIFSSSQKNALPNIPGCFIDNPLASDEDFLLVMKSVALANLAYNNSNKSANLERTEKEFIKALNIEEYRIWDDKNLVTGSIQSQAITGVIQNLSDKYSKPMPFVAFRGTASLIDAYADLRAAVTICYSTPKGNGVGQVALGFSSKLDEFRRIGLIDHLVKLMEQYQSGILVTGHSLGGALSTLFAAEVTYDYPELFAKGSGETPIVQVSFGSPRPVDKVLAEVMNTSKQFSHYLHKRFVNQGDLVPKVPFINHTGDCYYAPKGDPSGRWYVAKAVHNPDLAENPPACQLTTPTTDSSLTSSEDMNVNPLNSADLSPHTNQQRAQLEEQKRVFKNPSQVAYLENQFDFEIDYSRDHMELLELTKDFCQSEAVQHKLTAKGGYFDQLNKSQMKATIEKLKNSNEPDGGAKYNQYRRITELMVAHMK